MSNLAAALTLILAIETKNLDCKAVGDLHLPPERRAYGRLGIRKPVLEDLNQWEDGQAIWTRADSQNPELDVLMAQRWLLYYCGARATVKRYCQVWNGGPTGWRSPDAQAYYRRAITRRAERPEHYKRCKLEVERMIQ